MEKNKIIRVGIAGFGMSAQLFHAPFVITDNRFCLKKIYERSSDNARGKYPDVQTVRNYDELLTDDIDLVVICTPNPLHLSMAKQALEAGKNVIVEKPVAATADEAMELVNLAQEKGVFYSPYQNRRFDGDFLTICHLIENDCFGNILEYYARYDRYVTGSSKKAWKAHGGRGVNILYDLGVHLIDQAYCLFGMPVEVYADFHKERAESTEFDAFEVILYYKSKKAILSATECAIGPSPHFVIYGEMGSYIKYGMDSQEEALKRGETPGQKGWGEDRADLYGSLTQITDGITKKQTIKTIPGNYGLFYKNVYEVLTLGVEQAVDPMDAVNVLRIIEAAMQSASTGKRETVDRKKI